jgi:hypothetical protein
MLGRTHLAFGLGISLPAVGLAGMGLAPGQPRDHLVYNLAGARAITVAHLHPLAWAALAAAAALGALLPDIDQPGSLVTRLPASQNARLRRTGGRLGIGLGGTTARVALALATAGGRLSTALLGGYGGRLVGLFRLLLCLLALVAAAEAAAARWLPPAGLLAWPPQARQFTAIGLMAVAGGAGLVATGGLAGLVHRLPGHHRGWTHAPPVALGLGAASLLLGPLLAPSLPGIGAAFACGYLSHLAADACTRSGIPLWWAGQSRPSLHLLPRPLRVRTGSAGESLFNLCWPPCLTLLVMLAGR